MKTNKHTQGKLKPEKRSTITRYLNLHNDDIHTFDYVIDTLIEVCDHDEIQAEQCAFLTHHKGESNIKTGTLEYLKPIQGELLNRGLKVTIE